MMTKTTATVASKRVVPTPPSSLPTTPTPPQGYTPSDAATIRKYQRLPKGNVGLLTKLAAELAASTTYGSYFPAGVVPPQEQVVSLLQGLILVERATGAAELWAKYLNDERAALADWVMYLLGPIAGYFKLLVKADSKVAAQYPTLLAFLALRAKPAKRGHQTRRAKSGKTKAKNGQSPPRSGQ